MKNLVLWLYDTFPSFADHLPPALLYFGLWVVIVFVAVVAIAFTGFALWWAIAGLVGRFVFAPAMGLAIGCLGFVTRLVAGNQRFSDPVHPVIRRVVIVDDLRQSNEADA